MRRLGKILLITVLSIALLIGGAILSYRGAYPIYSYRYRMTVEVMVDGALRSGSSVIEVKLITQPSIITNTPPVLSKIRGEAVFVDLGEGRNVVALLASGPNASNVNYPGYIVSMLFKLSMVKPEDLEKYSKLEGRRDLQDDQLPTFVTFADLNDPKTARLVSTAGFEEVFGPDVHFKRVWIEMSTEPATRGIDKKMPVIIEKLREEAKKSHARWVGSPYSAALGQFSAF